MKKTNKEILKFLVKFFLMVISLIFFIIHSNRFKLNPFDRDYQIIPTYLSLDSKDNIYAISNTWRRIYKIDKYGIIRDVLEGDNKNNIYGIWNISVDADDNLYLMNVVYDVETQRLEKEEILKYTPSGTFEKVLVLDYKVLNKDIYSGDYKIRAMTTYNNCLFVLIKESEEDGGVYKIKNNNEMEKIISIKDPSFVNRIAVMENRIVVLYTNNNILVYDYKNRANPQNVTKLLEEGSFLNGVSIDNDFYFCDSWQRQVRKFSFIDKKEKVLLSKKSLKERGYDYNRIHFSYLDANEKSKRIIAFEAFSHTIINFDTEGNVNFLIKDITLNSRDMLFNILVSLSLFISLYLFVNILYNYVFVRYVSIIIKIIFLTVPAVIAAILYITNRSYERLYSQLEKELSDKIRILTGALSSYIDISTIENIKGPKNYSQEGVDKVLEKLQEQFRNITKISEFESTFYIFILVIRNNEIYIIGDKYSGVFSPHIYPDGYYDSVFKEGKLKVGKYSNYDGNFFAVTIPLKNEEGRIICALESVVYTDEYDEIENKIKKDMLKNILIFTLLFIVILNFVILLLIYPLKTIRNAMKNVENGDLETQVEIKRKDEIGDIGKSFNSMIISLVEKEKIRDLMNKVVSKEIAEKLLKEGIKFEGERIEGTVLFADIRGFTKMCENMEPEEVIDMLNHYFNRMAKVINSNYGIIDKYVGDQIMALYGIPLPILGEDGKKLDAFYAVKTAVELIRTCEETNRERELLNKKPIKIGVGINRGYFVAGNIGSEDRLNYTVIGDDVNLGSRLCSNAPEMTILINESVYEEVKEYFKIEKLDPIYVKGKTAPINVYKVIV